MNRIVRTANCAALAAIVSAVVGIGSTEAATVSSYMIIAMGDADGGHALAASNVELGAIDSGLNSNGPEITDPVGSWSIDPVGSVGGVDGIGPSAGPTYDGDVAISNTDPDDPSVTLSNTNVFSINRLADDGNNQGSQGIDCAQSYDVCTSDGSQLTSNNFHAIPPLDDDAMGTGGLGDGDGVGAQGGYDFSLLFDELDLIHADLTGASTGVLDIGSSISSDMLTSYGSGLHLIDLTSSDTAKVLLEMSTWIIDGLADTFVIFRLEEGKIFDIEQSNLVIGDGGIGLENILFLTDADQGEASFEFDDVVFNGMSFWDYGGMFDDNSADFDNVIGCGQIVIDYVNFQDVGMSHCAFTPTTIIPVPAALPLGLSGLVLLGVVGWRRRRAV